MGIILSYRKWTDISLLEAFAIPISSYFGMTVRDANDVDTKTSARLTLFILFISGSLFWYSYVGELTSTLAIPSEYKPFQSPEGLINTNHRYENKVLSQSSDPNMYIWQYKVI